MSEKYKINDICKVSLNENVCLYNGRIEKAKSDVIVNASNGCGYMGGKACSHILRQGVAESIQFYTNGKVESEAMVTARLFRYIPSFIIGKKPGSIFLTKGYELNCKEIIHAVTMRYPGSHSQYQWVQECIEAIMRKCVEKGYKTISMPLLGAGTGGLNQITVLEMINSAATRYPQLNVIIYCISDDIKALTLLKKDVR